MLFRLDANYSSNSVWFLDFDLREVAEWYIRWDTLYVKFLHSDLDFTVIEPDVVAENDHDAYKSPDEIFYE